MRKISFKDLYKYECDKPTPRQAFIKDCALATGLAETTITQWAHGVQVPNPSALKLLAKHLNCDPDSLFPTTTKTKTNENNC